MTIVSDELRVKIYRQIFNGSSRVRNKKSRLIEDNGDSKTYGINVYPYPKRDYLYPVIPLSNDGFPVRVVFSGISEDVNGCYRKRINSDVYSFELVVEGTVEFVQSGVKHVVTPGMLLFVKKGSDSELIYGEYLKKRCLCVEGDLLNSILNSTGIIKNDVFQLSNADFKIVDEIYSEIYSNLKEDCYDNALMNSSLCYKLIMVLSRYVESDSIPPRLSRIVKYLDNNINKNLSLSDMCHRFGLSKSTINREFKEHFRQSPVDYFLEKKSLAAKYLIENTDLSMKEIAAEMGYSSQIYFSNDFKKRYGLAPSKFR